MTEMHGLVGNLTAVFQSMHMQLYAGKEMQSLPMFESSIFQFPLLGSNTVWSTVLPKVGMNGCCLDQTPGMATTQLK